MVNEKDYLLTNQEILGGLKAAIARGEELKDAMMTFYQAGYDKSEIEEAAKSYIEMISPAGQQSQKPLTKKERKAKAKVEKKKKKEEGKKPKEGKETKENKKIHSSPQPLAAAGKPKPIKETKQKVSKYNAPKNKPAKPPGGKAITIVLILVLLLLLGILTSVVLFREELIGFFNGMFA